MSSARGYAACSLGLYDRFVEWIDRFRTRGGFQSYPGLTWARAETWRRDDSSRLYNFMHKDDWGAEVGRTACSVEVGAPGKPESEI